MAWWHVLSRAEWIAIAAATVSLSSAVAAWLVFRMHRRDRRVGAPTIRFFRLAYDDTTPMLDFAVDADDADRWRIGSIAVKRPSQVRLATVIYGPDDRGGEIPKKLSESTKKVSLRFPSSRAAVAVLGARGSVVEFQISFVARASGRIRSKQNIEIEFRA
jgi:hypothetical protein